MEKHAIYLQETTRGNSLTVFRGKGTMLYSRRHFKINNRVESRSLLPKPGDESIRILLRDGVGRGKLNCHDD